MTDSLAERAAQARAKKLAAETKAQADRERERQRELQKLQNTPSAQAARQAAQRWFSEMGVDPVNTQVTERKYGVRRYNDEGYIETHAEWYSTFLTWRLEDHSYYGDYREYSILSEQASSATYFAVEIAIKSRGGKTSRRPANTLAELGNALEEESRA